MTSPENKKRVLLDCEALFNTDFPLPHFDYGSGAALLPVIQAKAANVIFIFERNGLSGLRLCKRDREQRERCIAELFGEGQHILHCDRERMMHPGFYKTLGDATPAKDTLLITNNPFVAGVAHYQCGIEICYYGEVTENGIPMTPDLMQQRINNFVQAPAIS